MGIIDKVKLFFKANTVGASIIKEAKAMEGNKPGWKKTEFWINLLTVHVPTFYATVQGFIPPEIAAYIHIGGTAAFALFNTVQKAIENWKTVKTKQTTVTTTAPATTVTTPS